MLLSSQKRCMLLFILSLSNLVQAFKVEARAGEDPDTCEPLEVDDGPTNNNAAGIGMEFETMEVHLEPKDKTCDVDKRNAAKGHTVSGKKGTNWELTADTGFEDALSLEYILSGKTIMLGSGDLEKAADDAAGDFVCSPRNLIIHVETED